MTPLRDDVLVRQRGSAALILRAWRKGVEKSQVVNNGAEGTKPRGDGEVPMVCYGTGS